MKKEEILGIGRCNCGRSRCQYFNGAIGDGGRSFSEEEIKGLLEDERDHSEVVKHLENLLNQPIN